MSRTTAWSTAREAASYLDSWLRHERDERAVLALFRTNEARPDVIQLEGELLEALQARPRQRCTAACVSCLGSATDLHWPERPRVRIRVTLAVACCTTAALIRYRDGRVLPGTEVDGDFYTALRGTVELEPCGSCGSVGRRENRADPSLWA